MSNGHLISQNTTLLILTTHFTIYPIKKSFIFMSQLKSKSYSFFLLLLLISFSPLFCHSLSLYLFIRSDAHSHNPPFTISTTHNLSNSSPQTTKLTTLYFRLTSSNNNQFPDFFQQPNKPPNINETKTHTHTHTHTHIYIYIERERERERLNHAPLLLC